MIPEVSNSKCSPRARGFTLIEMLVAVTLTLIMMFAVVSIFGLVGESISASRATLEMSGRLRAAQATLQADLGGLTVTMVPPRDPEANEGYFEYIEGPVGVVVSPDEIAVRPDPDDPDSTIADTTVGDFDDILMFTIRSHDKPFVGKYTTNGIVESDVAEIAWFVRGNTLYRRVLLVAPDNTLYPLPAVTTGFFRDYDISVRREGGTLLANTLGDLTKRENRFAHQTDTNDDDAHDEFDFPHSASAWGQLGLPTLRECSAVASVPVGNWLAGYMWPWDDRNTTITTVTTIDLWNEPHPWSAEVDRQTGALLDYMGTRVAEDVILTNVIGFDVKAWDPAAPVLRGVDDNDTPATLSDRADYSDDSVLANVAVVPGDPGYALALEHLVLELEEIPANRDQNYMPISYGAYVDLNYMCLLGPDPSATTYPYYLYTELPNPSRPHFYDAGDSRSSLRGTSPHTNPPATSWAPAVYDTWSTHYEHDGYPQDDENNNGRLDIADTPIDEGTDGFDSPGNGIDDDGNGTVDDNDDNGNGIIDDAHEQETSPPYPYPLRGIQVKIRVFEPDSRQIREVTIRQDFLPK